MEGRQITNIYPNLFVVGAMKAGTTTAYEMLASAPDVTLSSIKEPNHFCIDLYNNPDFALTHHAHNFADFHWIKDRQEYLSLFAGMTSRWRGEASTTYLYSKLAAREIHRANPDARVVILLRNPIDRAYSEYLMNLSIGVTLAPFSQVIREDYERTTAGELRLFERYISAGLYSRQIERYFDIFPRDQILVEIIDRPGIGFSKLSERLSEFLGVQIIDLKKSMEPINSAKLATLPQINHMLYATGLKGRMSRAIPKGLKNILKKTYYRSAYHSGLGEHDRHFLENVFESDIGRLASYLDEDLGFWLSEKKRQSEFAIVEKDVDVTSTGPEQTSFQQGDTDKIASQIKVTEKKSIAFVWSNFGPYHSDRLESAAKYFDGKKHIMGVEVARSTADYPWDRIDQINSIEHITLFPAAEFESTSSFRRFFSLLRVLLRRDIDHIFLCHYNIPEVFFVAAVLRLCGRQVYLMIESKFDDKPRFLLHELRKVIAFWPYCGALVGGRRTREYLSFFGFKNSAIQDGYDTVSGGRIRKLACAPPAPDGVAFEDRHFTIVARLVPKKNLSAAIKAYNIYRSNSQGSPRELHIFGSGQLEGELLHLISRLDISGVRLFGFVQAPEVAAALGKALALILPSTEEQWGLVINEALAMGLPILCSDNVGARDSLVRAGINGMVFEPDNIEGLAYFMMKLATDKDEWIRFCKGSTKLAYLADTTKFAEGVAAALNANASSSAVRY